MINGIDHLAWHSPKVERRTTAEAGDGLFAKEALVKDEKVAIWGGVIVSTAELMSLPEQARHRSVQVEEDHHLCSGLYDDPADCVNHSCNPNAGVRGQIVIVAMRDIAPDEQICIDYAMTDSYPQFSMTCMCGEAQCRHQITGEDWKLPDLQARYRGYFSPYLARRMG